MTSNPGRASRWGWRLPGRSLLRLGVTAASLVLLVLLVDFGQVWVRLARLEPAWAAAAVATAAAQVLLLAWRWRFTAGRLGIELPYREALREYYAGIFLNQILPGGVAGDVTRAWRHVRRERNPELGDAGSPGRAVRAVVLERASAQAVMLPACAVSLLWIAYFPSASGTLGLLGGGMMVLALAAFFLGRRMLRSNRVDGWRSRTLQDLRAGLLAPAAFSVQLATGVLVVASYILVFAFAARSVHAEGPFLLSVLLAAPVLVAMLLPVSVAGWGVREGAAALLWGAVGLDPAEGVAVSVAYGLLVLASTLPATLPLAVMVGRGWAPNRRGPDRRAHPRPGGSADTVGEGPPAGFG